MQGWYGLFRFPIYSSAMEGAGVVGWFGDAGIESMGDLEERVM